MEFAPLAWDEQIASSMLARQGYGTTINTLHPDYDFPLIPQSGGFEATGVDPLAWGWVGLGRYRARGLRGLEEEPVHVFPGLAEEQAGIWAGEWPTDEVPPMRKTEINYQFEPVSEFPWGWILGAAGVFVLLAGGNRKRRRRRAR